MTQAQWDERDASERRAGRKPPAAVPSPAGDREDKSLRGVRVLIVEDDFLLLLDLEGVLEAVGATVASGCRDVEKAVAAVTDSEIDVAILDVRIGRQPITQVARALAERKIPFLFYTGQLETDPILAEWPDRKVISKPASRQVIVGAIEGVLVR